MDASFGALLLGTFLAETVKIVAKGTANWVAANGESLFYSEITALGLAETAEPADIAKQLDANPAMMTMIERKIDASPDFVKELFENLKKELENNSAGRNIVQAKNIGTVINEAHSPITITNNFPD